MTIEEYPWQAALLDNNGDAFCGGTIIGKRFILTAQHCVVHFAPQYVGVGKSRKSAFVISDGSSSAPIRVEAHIKYPRYDPMSDGIMGKDTALLVLTQPLTFSKLVRSIPIADSFDSTFTSPGRKAFVSGWGSTRYGNDNYPDYLRAARIKIVSNKFASKSGLFMNADQLAAGQFPGAGRSEYLKQK